MIPNQFRASQVQATPTVNGGSAVRGITDDGMANGGGMPSDLVSASCAEFPFQKAGVFVNGPRPHAQASKRRETSLSVNRKTDNSLLGNVFAHDPGVIGLLKLGPVGLERGESRLGLGYEDRTSRSVIQPVNGLQECG